MLEEDVVGLDRRTAKQGTVTEAQFKEPRPPPIPEGTDDDDWTDDDEDPVAMCDFDSVYPEPDYQP